MYEICELIRYGDDERQLALEQLFAKAGVKTCSQAVSASKSTTSRSYLHSCGQSSSCRQYCFLCHVTKNAATGI